MMAERNGLTTRLNVFSSLLQRVQFAQGLGLTHDGKRKLYTTLGYPGEGELQYENYKDQYRRGDIAARIIKAFPAATWHHAPVITEREKADETTLSAFEEAWQGLVERLQVYQVFERADRLASIGHYGVLLIGVRGQTDFAQPLRTVGGAEAIAWLAAYSEEHTRIVSLHTNDAENFGMPEMYEIDFSRTAGKDVDAALRPLLMGTGLAKTRVHGTRVIHIAEEGMEDNIIGTPRLRPIWNRLLDLEKVLGGSAEMFWQDAKRRFALTLSPDAHMDKDAAEALTEEVEEFVHELRSFMRLQGMEVTQFNGTVADPSSHVDKLLDVIAGTVGMPKRMLIGSERGELASSQDENNWAMRILERQKHFAEPIILRPFIARLQQIRALPLPQNGYEVEWPQPAPSEVERSTVALNWAKVFQTYASLNEGSIQEVLPLEIFLNDIVGFSKEQIERIMKEVEKAKAEREAEDAEERATQDRMLREREAQRVGQVPQEDL